MDDIARSNSLNGIQERQEDGLIVLDPVPLDMNDHDAEGQLFEIDLEFEALVDGDENVKLSLRVGGQFGVRQSAPVGFGDGQNLVIRERLPNARIDALV